MPGGFTLLFYLSMLGYLINSKVGAWMYNLIHHKLLAIALMAFGFWFGNSLSALIGILLFGHSALDRVFGYGLKYLDHFKNTHLGRIG
ncbi:DUF4260 family protein [Reichenbachiella ulvae]|uniref:DUF4260 family protein n=1 Tax=Reichenbachiella ulvae TaxID=2980104 RepID=UPI00298FA97A|nr:DUF4260 family protein [Reichenbachiella ulvae]